MRTRPKRGRLFRIIATSAGVVFIVIIASGLWLQSRMQDILIKEINNQLTAKVKVKDISFSLFSSFPYARLRFSEVLIPDNHKQQIPLLEAASLTLNFSVIDIIRKNYNIRFIGIEHGSLSISIPENGEPNYLILKEGDTEGDAVGFALRKVKINDVNLSYKDVRNNIIADIYCSKTVFRGDFSAEEYNTGLSGDISIRQVKVGKDKFFSGQSSYLDMILKVDNIRGVYTFTRGNLRVAGLPFRLTGTVEHGDGHKEINLAVEGDNMKIGHLLKLLPEEMAFIEEEYTPNGTVTFTGNISGSYDGNKSPAISFAYGIENGSLNHKKSGIMLGEISCSGTYNYSEHKCNDLEVKSFSASLGKGSISGRTKVVDLSAPVYQVDLIAELEVADLLSFYPVKNIQRGSGKIKIDINAETSTTFNETLSATQLLNSRTNGEIELNSVSVETEKEIQLLKDISGKMTIDNNDLNISSLQGLVMDNKVVFSGFFRNLLPYLLIKDQMLEFNGSLSSPIIDLKKWLFQGESGNTSNNAHFKIPDNINGVLDITIAKLVYDKFTPKDIKAKISISPGKILARDVGMFAFRGKANGAVMLAQKDDHSFMFDCELNTERVDIHQMFKQFNNFGQDDLTDRNLEGLLTSRIRILSQLTPQLIFNMSSLDALGDLVVENGALLNYEPVKALARYTRLDDLSNIRFNTLRNEIRIAENKIIIPEMMILSDAIDLSVAGIHNFNGEINYQVRLLLSELLSGKAKRINRQRSDIDLSQQDQKGRITIYLLIEGTAINPVVRYDRKGQRSKLNKELKTEKEEMRDLFKKEFGIFNPSNEKPEKQSTQQKEGVIIIEWDDD